MITRIGNRELALLCERVAVGFDIGQDPLRVFQREAGDGRSRHGRHMQSIAERIRRGCSLSEAIREQGDYFPPNFHRLIEVGEKSGRLEKVLERMADHYKEVADLQRTFRGSLLLPMVQLGLAVLVVSFLIFIPALLAPNPGDVVDLLGFGLVGGRGLAIFWAGVAGVAAAVAAIWRLTRNGTLAFLGDWILRVPVLGRAILVFDEATFVQSLGLATESGVNAATAVAMSFAGASSALFKGQARAAKGAILQGREIHDVLRDTGLFSRETIEAVALGEASGRLAEVLDKHFVVLRMRVRFLMAAVTKIASTAVWSAVAALLAMLVFRLFGRYVSQINQAVMETGSHRGFR